MMQKLIVDAKTGQERLVNMTAKEQQDRLAEIALSQQEEDNQIAKENQKAAALVRLQTAALSNTNLADLLTYLGAD